MKNLIKISLTLMITIVSILVLTVTSKATTKLKVTGDTLNIRKGPSTNTNVIAMLFKGVECELLEEDGDWYKIKYKTYTGYVSKEYVEIVGEPDNTEEPINTNNNQTNENNTDNITKNEENNNTVNNTQKSEQIVYKKLKQNVEIKLLPLIHSSIIESGKKDTKVILLNEVVGWSYIQTDTNCGWIRTENLKSVDSTSNVDTSVKTVENYTEKTAYINESSVNLRKGAGTTYNIIKTLSLNTQLTIIGEEEKWYKVKVGDITGYVSKELVSDTKTTTTRSSKTSRIEDTVVPITDNTKVEETTTKNIVTNTNNTTEKSEQEEVIIQNTVSESESTIKGTDIVAYAKKYLGYKYVYGGDGSNGTFDCSGFTMYVFKHFGIKIPHGANSQYKCGKGTKITKYSDLQIGDIVMLTDYETGEGIGHCGIYVGNDNFIHASTTCNAVEISSFKTIYKGRFYAGLRLI